MFITWMIHLLRWYLDDVHIETPPRRHKKHRTYYKPRSLGKIDQHIQHLTKLRNDWGTWPSTWNPLAPQCELRSCFEALIHERFFWWATSTSTSVSLAYACVPYTKWITHTHTKVHHLEQIRPVPFQTNHAIFFNRITANYQNENSLNHLLL